MNNNNNSSSSELHQRSSAIPITQNHQTEMDHHHQQHHTQESIPLMTQQQQQPQQPPLANAEVDDTDDEVQTNSSTPKSGAHDEVFIDAEKPQGEPHPPDAPPYYEIPDIFSRAGIPDDQVDGTKTPLAPGSHLSPSFRHDLEIGTIAGDLESIPDVNVYQHKKTLAQGMMDLALFSANANQLRYVVESYSRHPYYYPSLVMLIISLCFQIAVGIGLIWNATYNVKDEKEICIANKINNFTIIGIFLVTAINVFISAFGVANPAP